MVKRTKRYLTSVQMALTPSVQEPRRFPGLKNVSAEWHTLTWVGFISTATDQRVFYLDNVQITPQP